MSRPIVLLRDMGMRLPQAGRIRIGKKGPKGQPVKLPTFRFTSSDHLALDEIAAAYGGKVSPWSDPKAAAGQFEIITEAKELRVALPPDPLGSSPCYELWTGGGCQRRCDGETCELLVRSQDGLDLQQVPCLCSGEGVLACKVTTRLSVLLPDVRFVGVWRLDSHGWAAAQELPGMVSLIRSMQDKGIIRGILRCEERTQVVAGQTNKFVVPVLGLDESVNALASGMAQVGSLGAGSGAPVAELGAGSSEGEGNNGLADLATPDTTSGPGGSPSADDEVIDAELVQSFADLVPVGVSDSKALVAVRDAAKARGIDPPMNIAEVTDPVLISAALDLLAPA